MGDAEVEDQTLAASLVSEVVVDLNVTALLACAASDPRCVRTVCPTVRNRVPRKETIQLFNLVAPE
jgi:hypothetical protein